VTFEINADGIVSVRAKDLETNKEQSIEVTASSGLTREESLRDDGEREGSDVERRTSRNITRRRRNRKRRKLVAEDQGFAVGRSSLRAFRARREIEKARAIVERRAPAYRQEGGTAVKGTK